ncbi:pyridoxamine 5'-phosphate oxidase family protein [Halocatena halophila]|uniref:pyridoxamine 5'-phosphate oxidase family protein n=1 Tax=Halocatena halophila TaxID=2814576 RepID=UPI002ED603CC
MDVPPDVEQLITDAKLMAHIATAVDSRPHVAPVWYGYDDGVLSILTTGKKLENIRKNPRVAVSIEQHTDGNAEWMISLLGTASVFGDDPSRINEAAREIFPKYLGPDEDTWPEYIQQALSDDPPESLVTIEIASATVTRF